MIPTPFRFEKDLTPDEFQKLGQLMLRWSHTEHIIGHCLRLLLGLSEEHADIMVFPLSLEHRLQRIVSLIELKPLIATADVVYRELVFAVKALQPIRNQIAHAILLPNAQGEHEQFYSRRSGRSYGKEQIIECEELFNYAAHAALLLRNELGDRDDAPGPLPQRPAPPAFLQSRSPTHPNQ
jgi:hypothetical protein